MELVPFLLTIIKFNIEISLEGFWGFGAWFQILAVWLTKVPELMFLQSTPGSKWSTAFPLVG